MAGVEKGVTSLTFEGLWSRRITGIAPVSKTGVLTDLWVRVPPAPLYCGTMSYAIRPAPENEGYGPFGNGVGNAIAIVYIRYTVTHSRIPMGVFWRIRT